MSVQALIDKYAKAVSEQNIEHFLSLYHQDIVAYDAWDRWSYQGNHQWRQVPTDWFTQPGEEDFHATFREVFVEGKGDIVVVRGLIDYRSGNTDLDMITNRFSWILKKFDGEYRIVHEHTSMPVDRETGHYMRGQA